MVEPFLKLIEKLVNDFSWRRLVVFLLLVSFILAGVVGFELLTGYFRLSRLEKEVTLLGELYEIQAKQNVPAKSLVKIHASLAKELEELAGGQNGHQVNPRLLQSLAALLPWIVLSLGFLPDFKRDEKDATKSLLGVLFFAVPVVAVGASLSPRIGAIWRYVVYPASTITLLIIAGLIGKWRESRQRKRLLQEDPLPVPSAQEICVAGDPREIELRRNVSEVLMHVSLKGLKGNRHLFVQFSTTAPGVAVPASLREKHPDSMSIILQHKFWDLDVQPNAFFVTLEFSDKRERLSIPYSSIMHFSSPEDGIDFTFLPTVPDSASGLLETANPAPATDA
jgi:hypothetical protein